MGKVNFVQCQIAERGPYAPISICPKPPPMTPTELAEVFADGH